MYKKEEDFFFLAFFMQKKLYKGDFEETGGETK